MKKDNIIKSQYALQATSLREKLKNEILKKKESTAYIAISLANNEDLAQRVEDKNFPQNYFNSLIKRLKTNKKYKNVWIQIVNKDGVSLYRSWTKKRYDSLIGFRQDLEKILKTHKLGFWISIGKFDLSFKTIVPVFKNNSFTGIVEVITHFNSISEALLKKGIGSVVIAKKENQQQLRLPFTKIFIGKYYVANLDAPLKLRNYLKNNGIENYFNNSYKVENGYLIVSHLILSIESKTIGYYIMFQKLENIKIQNIETFIFKYILFLIVIFLLLSVGIASIFLVLNKRQKEHYRNIIDSSTNIMIINNMKVLVSANKAFFKVFDRYKTIQEFLKEHECICDFFVKEEKYIQKYMDKKIWIEYLANNQNKEHKAKVDFYGNIYYFIVSASLVDEDLNQYCVVLTNITKEEKYKKRLEILSITDTLTNVYNRRFFDTKIVQEINRAKRYKLSMSVIMFDIDYFKKVNDKYGHDVGDEVLIAYSKLISSYIRVEDFLCRVGGEEFIIILPHLKLENAMILAEKLRKMVEQSKVVRPITMSFGVIEYIPGESKDYLYKRLDDALYKAKENGRNTVVAG
jgi:diguanylate cyclase (GGDEF)-like protein